MRRIDIGMAKHPLGRALLAGVAVAILAAPAFAQSTALGTNVPGASVEELLAIARRLNPEIAMRVLESEAAAAKASAAGALDDPTIKVTSDEIDRTEGPRMNKMIYSVEQEFPLWGKRDLRRRIAEAEANGAKARERAATLELEARVKAAFAQYYRAARSLAIEHDVHALLHAVARTAQTRYGQGIGSQSEAIRAEVERSRLDIEFATIERDKRAAQGRLNALLARPAGTPFAEPVALRPVPAVATMQMDALLERARQGNPRIGTASADIAAADAGRQLADKAWYPDVTLGGSAITREDGPSGYMAMVGLKVPLQWGLRQAQTREATARMGVAQAQREAALLDIQGDLSEAIAGLDAAQQTEKFLRESLGPQTDAAYRSALTSYQNNRGDLTGVLIAAHHVQEVRLEIIKSQAEQQKILADIERTIGGEL